MSLKITDVISWKFNPETECIEFTVKMPDLSDAVVVIPETKFSEIIDIVPELEEERQLKKLLDSLYDIRKRRLLTVEEIDKLVEDMRKKHQDLRDRLTKCKDKATLFALTAESKDLGTEKVLFDTKRHLVALMLREESRIRADIARKQASRGLS